MEEKTTSEILEELNRSSGKKHGGLILVGLLAVARYLTLNKNLSGFTWDEKTEENLHLDSLGFELTLLGDIYKIWNKPYIRKGVPSNKPVKVIPGVKEVTRDNNFCDMSVYPKKLVAYFCNKWAEVTDKEQIAKIYRDLIKLENKIYDKEEKILSESVEALGTELLNISDEDALYVVGTNINMLRPTPAYVTCCVNYNLEWQWIWRTLEYLSGKKPQILFTDILGNIVDNNNNGENVTFDKVLLQVTPEMTVRPDVIQSEGILSAASSTKTSKHNLDGIAYALHMLEDTGKAVVILDTDALYDGKNISEQCKEMLLKPGYAEAVISLPDNQSILLLSKAEGNRMLSIDGTRLVTEESGEMDLSMQDVKRIVDIVREKKIIAGISKYEN